MNLTHPSTLFRLDQIRRVIQSQPMTSHEIGAAIGLSERWVMPYLTHLHGEREVYVAGWQRAHTGWAARYRLGKRKDAARPRNLTRAEQNERAAANLRNDPDRYARHLAKLRIRRSKAKFDPLVAALFGSKPC